MKNNILLVKETRSGELRVGLIPSDIRKLVDNGYRVFVEENAGSGIGASDQDYVDNGAIIRKPKGNDVESYKTFFKEIGIIVRAKRPEMNRENLENLTIAKGTVMIGTLDQFNKNSSHVDAYHKQGIIAYSIDQLKIDSNNPMNVLAAMSEITGRLALRDAVCKFNSTVRKIVIVGYGTAGRSAFKEAVKLKLHTVVVLRNHNLAEEIKNHGSGVLLLKKDASLKEQQLILKELLRDADIVITSARKSGEIAPILIPFETLNSMKKGAVIVDLALSEGGNVEGSMHDSDNLLGNDVLVTNISGYPKVVPLEASKKWSAASLLFILNLRAGKIKLSSC